ncbi:MAG: UDP-galactose-lipid carrier transferase [Acidobacteria bacterium]|nr:UDP-galactose-lipid carrier transferase [Acidobacteriota bacterium]MBI3661541.1 UDP-galactose-lipid carrier transferase [Acidobacteriota bacterium]
MLETVDLKKTLSKSAYAKRMPELQEKLRGLQYAVHEAEVPVIICLEGWDTAGKGRVIKKLTEKLDPRLFRVHPGSAPSPLEQRYHYLWRYQMKLPNDGEMAVFDHSWYGRVLVERCDKVAPKKVWREAYEQINEFERWLADDGQVVMKFWMHISKKEQKQRFKDCLKDPLLRWKITKEYRRHHRQYSKWLKAVEEMLAKTDTPHAPWTVVEANDLRWARVRIFETIVKRIEETLARRKALPAAVSRTAAAAAATKTERAERAARDKERAREEEKKTLAAEVPAAP